MQIIQISIGILTGVVIYAAMAVVMRMEEAQQALRVVKRKLGK